MPKGAAKGNKNAVGNKGGGRKSEYKPEYVKMGYKLALMGATDKDLSAIFEVDERTIARWRKEHPEFMSALKKGKQQADAEIANKLFHRASGYSHMETDIRVIDGEIVKTQVKKHYPPDTTAAIFWLKNRQPGLWRDKQEIDHTTQGKSMKSDMTDSQLEKLISAIHAGNKATSGSGE